MTALRLNDSLELCSTLASMGRLEHLLVHVQLGELLSVYQTQSDCMSAISRSKPVGCEIHSPRLLQPLQDSPGFFLKRATTFQWQSSAVRSVWASVACICAYGRAAACGTFKPALRNLHAQAVMVSVLVDFSHEVSQIAMTSKGSILDYFTWSTAFRPNDTSLRCFVDSIQLVIKQSGCFLRVRRRRRRILHALASQQG